MNSLTAAAPAYLAIARASFRRWSTYRQAMWAGLITNVFFGFINTYVLGVIFEQRPQAGGYDRTEAITYVWVAQGLIAVVGAWGNFQLADRVRSGDVAVDLIRPWNWHLALAAEDIGRAAFNLLIRGVVPVLIAVGLFGVSTPAGVWGWVAFALSTSLAVGVCFAARLMINLSAFWMLDIRGLVSLWAITAPVLGGLLLPIGLFPGWAQAILWSTPFPALIQTPADTFTGRLELDEVLLRLGHQVLWLVVLSALGALVIRRARHRLIVQGG